MTGRDALRHLDYQAPFKFTGTLYGVAVDVSGELIKDLDAEVRAAFSWGQSRMPLASRRQVTQNRTRCCRSMSPTGFLNQPRSPSAARGCLVKQIAEMLDWKSLEIEAALDAISSTLCRRTRWLLAWCPQVPNRFQGMRSETAEESKLRKPSPAVGSRRQRCWTAGRVALNGSEPVTFWP